MSRASRTSKTSPRKSPSVANYSPSLCRRVLTLGKKGLSPSEMAQKMGVSDATLAGWAKTHPDFALAMTNAYYYALGWWEKKGRLGLFQSQRFDTLDYIRQMTTRFPEHYSASVCVEHTVALGGRKHD